MLPLLVAVVVGLLIETVVEVLVAKKLLFAEPLVGRYIGISASTIVAATVKANRPKQQIAANGKPTL